MVGKHLLGGRKKGVFKSFCRVRESGFCVTALSVQENQRACCAPNSVNPRVRSQSPLPLAFSSFLRRRPDQDDRGGGV